MHAPASLLNKHPGLRIDRPHGAPEPAFAGVLDELHIDGFRLDESVLVHHPSRTALLALPFDRRIVGHGEPLTSGAREAVAAAYAWLPP